MDLSDMLQNKFARTIVENLPPEIVENTLTVLKTVQTFDHRLACVENDVRQILEILTRAQRNYEDGHKQSAG